MNKEKIISYIVLSFVLVYLLLIGIFADILAKWVLDKPSILQLFIYYITQPQIIMILIGSIYIGIMKKKLIGGISAGILLNLAGDISSTPHCVMRSGFIENAPNLILCSDTIFIKRLDIILPHIFSHTIYYLVLPIIFTIIGFELLGVTKFIKFFTNGK